MTKPQKLFRYSIHLDGFEPHTRVARSASAAKYADWKTASEVGYFAGRDGFKRYLEQCYVLHLGRVEDGPATDREAQSK